MPALGIGIVFFGYWVAYYGLTQITGGNWGFFDLGVPGRWTADTAATPKDGIQGTDTGHNAPGQPTGPVVASGTTPGAAPATPGGPGAGFPNALPGSPNAPKGTTAPGSTGDTTPLG